MKNLGEQLKQLRDAKNISLKTLSLSVGMDSSILHRFEKNERIPSKEQLKKIAAYYKTPLKSLDVLRLKEKIYQVLEDEENGHEALILAESESIYFRSSEAVEIDFSEINKLKKELDKLRPLPKAQLQNLYNFYKVNYTYNSNKIEGNTLSLKETALVIEKGITISGKSMNEHLEAVNHAEAIDLIEDFVSKKVGFNEYYLKQLHGLILRGIDKDNAGRYRKINVRISGAEHVPPQPYLLDKLMEDYFIFYEINKSKMHPVLLAAEMHERLVTIHPFIDGNGRTSRLVMNLILMQKGYPISSISADRNNRLQYYKALEEAQVNENKKMFYTFVCNTVKDALIEFLKIVR